MAKRPDGQARQDMATGQVEIIANDITVLNTCGDIPMQPREYQKKNEALRLKYRLVVIVIRIDHASMRSEAAMKDSAESLFLQVYRLASRRDATKSQIALKTYECVPYPPPGQLWIL